MKFLLSLLQLCFCFLCVVGYVDMRVLTLQPGWNQHHSTLEGKILTMEVLTILFRKLLLRSLCQTSTCFYGSNSLFTLSHMDISQQASQREEWISQTVNQPVTSFTQQECSSDQVQMTATQYSPSRGEMGEPGTPKHSFRFSVGQWCPAGVPNLWDQISDDLSWS